MLMCIDCMYHVIFGSSTKRCVAFLTVVGGLFSLNSSTAVVPSRSALQGLSREHRRERYRED